MWALPLVGGVLGAALSNLSAQVERYSAVPDGWTYSSGTALTVLTTVVAASVGLAGFVVTVTVLLVQMATGSFSARYMRVWYRDPILKAVLAVLVGTFTFSYSLLRRIEGDDLPNLGVTAAGLLLGVGLVLFLVFLDRFIRRMRPVKVAQLVAAEGRRAFRNTTRTWGGPLSSAAAHEAIGGRPPAFRLHSARAGAIRAVHGAGIVDWATRHDCVVVLTRAPGDFVSRGAALGDVHGRVADPARAEEELAGMVALGTERTMEQDPAFALRILSDIANKALSPGINDPTTAAQVIDHLEDLLAEIGTTPDLSEVRASRDAGGVVRLVHPAPRWQDFLALGVTEIRQFGATSVQILRRLRAMLVELRDAVVPVYVVDVDDEIRRLDQTVVEAFGSSVDLDLARVVDRQGLGGPTTRARGA